MTIEYYIAKRTGRAEHFEDDQSRAVLTMEYQVIIPDPDRMLGPPEVLAMTIGLPFPGQPFRHQNRILRVAQRIAERSQTHRDKFIVTIRWQWPYVPALKDPRMEFFPPSIGSWERQVALTKDAVTGKAIANSAGTPLAEFPQVDVGDQTISWKRIEDWYNQAYADLFWNHINSASVSMFGKQYAAGTLRCKSIIGVPVYKPVDVAGTGETLQKIFYETTYTFLANRSGWKFTYPDLGNAVLKDGKLAPPTPLKGGAPRQSAVYLNGQGAELTGENAEPVYLSAWEYPQADFSLLNIPADLPVFLMEP